MGDRRNYASGTTHGLYQLSRGYCYFPGCREQVGRLIDGEYYTTAQISHIAAHGAGGARFDPHMTDKERNSFTNLILLCKPHHELVDRRHPDRYPPHLLRQWKAERESGFADELVGLANLTPERLQQLIGAAVAETDRTLEAAIKQLSEDNQEAARILRDLKAESFNRPYVDVDAVHLLAWATAELDSLNLMGAADILASNVDTIADFTAACRTLENVDDKLATSVRELQQAAPELNASARHFKRSASQSNTPTRPSLTSTRARMSGASSLAPHSVQAQSLS